MLAAGNPMFLFIPNDGNERVLHPGKVIRGSAQTFEAEFDEGIAPAPGTNVIAYADFKGKFMQQGARVKELRQDAGHTTYVFDRVGEVVSAEQRQAYRVSSVTSGVVARIGKEERCAVLDISAEGMGAVVRHKLEMGTLVPVLMRFWNEEISTSMRVQTVIERPDGKFRCGLLAADQHSPARKTLQKISMALQRAQLSRLAGAA